MYSIIKGIYPCLEGDTRNSCRLKYSSRRRDLRKANEHGGVVGRYNMMLVMVMAENQVPAPGSDTYVPISDSVSISAFSTLVSHIFATSREARLLAGPSLLEFSAQKDMQKLKTRHTSPSLPIFYFHIHRHIPERRKKK